MTSHPSSILPARPGNGGWVPFLAHSLFILAAWTLVIKYLFLNNPDEEWSIWRTNWFINKIFVLLGFLLILATFTFARSHTERYRLWLLNAHP